MDSLPTNILRPQARRTRLSNKAMGSLLHKTSSTPHHRATLNNSLLRISMGLLQGSRNMGPLRPGSTPLHSSTHHLNNNPMANKPAMERLRQGSMVLLRRTNTVLPPPSQVTAHPHQDSIHRAIHLHNSSMAHLPRANTELP